MATDQTRFRQPKAEREAVKFRAGQVHKSNLSEVYRALGAAYAAGQVDAVVSAWLVRLAPGAPVPGGTSQPSEQVPS